MSKEPTFAEMFMLLLVLLFIVITITWLILKANRIKDLEDTIVVDKRTVLQDELRTKSRKRGYWVMLLAGALVGLIFVFALDEPPAHKSNKREKQIEYQEPIEDENSITE
jgi:di/tricarboxylate transporter